MSSLKSVWLPVHKERGDETFRNILRCSSSEIMTIWLEAVYLDRHSHPTGQSSRSWRVTALCSPSPWRSGCLTSCRKKMDKMRAVSRKSTVIDGSRTNQSINQSNRREKLHKVNQSINQSIERHSKYTHSQHWNQPINRNYSLNYNKSAFVSYSATLTLYFLS